MPLPRYNSKTIKGVFSDDEKRYLLKTAGTIPAEEMAEHLGRSVMSVKSQCQKQGIKYGFINKNRATL